MITNSQLRKLCIDNNWFTCGSISQYDKLFQANDDNAPIEELVTIIWICSSNATKDDIREKIEACVKFNVYMEYCSKCSEILDTGSNKEQSLRDIRNLLLDAVITGQLSMEETAEIWNVYLNLSSLESLLKDRMFQRGTGLRDSLINPL